MSLRVGKDSMAVEDLPTKHEDFFGQGKPEDTNGNVTEISAREKLLCDQPELLVQFGNDLFPVLVQVYGSSVNYPVRHKCLAVISKLVCFSTADMLLALLQVTNISSFLAGVLAWKDPLVLIPALQIAEVLIKKLPHGFSKMFVKEGVVHAVDTLISLDLSNPAPVQESALGKTLAKSTCNTQHSDGLHGEVTVKDETKGSSFGRVGPSLSSGEAATSTIKEDLRASISTHAKYFKDTYFPADSGVVDAGMTESLCNLKRLCKKLNDDLADLSAESKGKEKEVELLSANDEHLLDVVAEMLAELGKGDGVSTFEFVGSGVVASLLNFFLCGSLSKENVIDAKSSERFQQALKRFKLFIGLALPLNSADRREAPLTILVRKLQNALASLERFPLILSHARRSRSANANISAGLSALSQPLKLRLIRAEGEMSLRDYSSNAMLIHALDNLAAVEEFLWPRIQRSETAQKPLPNSSTSGTCAGQPATAGALSPSSSASEYQPSTRSRSMAAAKELDGANSSSLKGKEKDVLDGAADVTRGPQTRNGTSTRANKTSQLEQPQNDSGAEEEELDAYPVELDESVAMQEDISEDEDDEYEERLEEHLLFGEEQTPACMTERVHDIQLGDPMDDSDVPSSSATTVEAQSQPSPGAGTRATIFAGGVETSEFLTGASLVSKGSLSFARVSMSGLGSARGGGARGGRDSRILPLVNPAMVPPRLNFYMGGKKLDRSLTIYQAIQQQAVADEDDDKMYTGSDYAPGERRRLWDEVYNITYRRATAPEEMVCAGESTSSSSLKPTSTTSSSRTGTSWQRTSFLDSILQGELPCDLEKSSCTYDILLLLCVLEGINRLAPRLRAQQASDAFAEGKITSFDELKVKGPVVPQNEFLSSKLTAKLARQMQDPLALCSGGLPSWCHQLTKACPFLFPFETRRHYFYSASFGISRALQRLQQQQSAESPNLTNDQELRIGRLQRQKVRVSRNRILDSAAKVMEMYSSHKAVLEVEYFGEVGTGLGPTLEFYTLLSHELQRKELGMWRSISCPMESAMGDNIEMQDVEENGELSFAKEVGEVPTVETQQFVQAPMGLFPRPWPTSTDSSSGSHLFKTLDYFRLLGQVMAKALQDGRLLDLPLSTAFYKLILGQELDLFDIQSFDPELGNTLQEMQVLVHRKQLLESMSGDKRKRISELRFRNARIEDLCLDFTLPGYSDYVLKPGGNSIMVDINSLEEYVSLVVDATVKTGIMPQMEAFREGFNQMGQCQLCHICCMVFPLAFLQIFSENELETLLCGGCDLWAAQTLADHIKFDHGYTFNSPPIINLLEIMREFSPEQRRAFLRFVTGAPRLPPGGLASLNPKLTIVRKHPSGANGIIKGAAAQAADADLPSVMTCANYLKLPPYSCKEVMRDRLLYAITEGQGSFDLS
eukprot:Gb_07122 [translate_table: standard]